MGDRLESAIKERPNSHGSQTTRGCVCSVALACSLQPCAREVLGILMAAALLMASSAEAGMTYMVGDGAGWTRYLESWWLTGKTFRAGDVLVFRCDKAKHDVAWVSKGGYRRCIVSPRGRPPVYTSGHDAITLTRGTHYFICSKPGHCAAGMKLAVTAY